MRPPATRWVITCARVGSCSHLMGHHVRSPIDPLHPIDPPQLCARIETKRLLHGYVRIAGCQAPRIGRTVPPDGSSRA